MESPKSTISRRKPKPAPPGSVVSTKTTKTTKTVSSVKSVPMPGGEEGVKLRALCIRLLNASTVELPSCCFKLAKFFGSCTRELRLAALGRDIMPALITALFSERVITQCQAAYAIGALGNNLEEAQEAIFDAGEPLMRSCATHRCRLRLRSPCCGSAFNVYPWSLMLFFIICLHTHHSCDDEREGQVAWACAVSEC